MTSSGYGPRKVPVGTYRRSLSRQSYAISSITAGPRELQLAICQVRPIIAERYVYNMDARVRLREVLNCVAQLGLN